MNASQAATRVVSDQARKAWKTWKQLTEDALSLWESNEAELMELCLSGIRAPDRIGPMG